MEVHDDGESVYRECKCMKNRRIIRQMLQSGLKEVIERYTFDTYKNEAAWQTVLKKTARRYAESEESAWLFLGGQTGAGKTHLCTAVCRELLRRGIPVKYMLWKDESKELKRLATEPEQYRKKIEVYKTVDVLYIDDLFKGSVTPADVDLAFEIINYRAAKNLKTIISSELSTGELYHIDGAIAGRISYACGEKNLVNISKDENKNYRLAGLNDGAQQDFTDFLYNDDN